MLADLFVSFTPSPPSKNRGRPSIFKEGSIILSCGKRRNQWCPWIVFQCLFEVAGKKRVRNSEEKMAADPYVFKVLFKITNCIFGIWLLGALKLTFKNLLKQIKPNGNHMRWKNILCFFSRERNLLRSGSAPAILDLLSITSM